MVNVRFALALENCALFWSRLRSSRPKSSVMVPRFSRSAPSISSSCGGTRCAKVPSSIASSNISSNNDGMTQFVRCILGGWRQYNCQVGVCECGLIPDRFERSLNCALWRSNQNWPQPGRLLVCLSAWLPACLDADCCSLGVDCGLSGQTQRVRRVSQTVGRIGQWDSGQSG